MMQGGMADSVQSTLQYVSCLLLNLLVLYPGPRGWVRHVYTCAATRNARHLGVPHGGGFVLGYFILDGLRGSATVMASYRLENLQ